MKTKQPSKKAHVTMSFERGMERVFDLSGHSKRWPNINDAEQRDFEALRGDWEAVGKTLIKAGAN